MSTDSMFIRVVQYYVHDIMHRTGHEGQSVSIILIPLCYYGRH